MRPVRFGILACSSVARRRFIPALRGASGARLERVGSRDAAKAEAFAREFGGVKHGSYEALLDDPDVDAVYISTPPGLHAEWVHRAAEHRKHIWCEKPAFPDFATAREAVEHCRKAGVRLVEGYAFLHHPQHERARSLIAEGRIGEPKFFEAQFTYPRPPQGDIRLDPTLAGGVFHDSAGYPVAAALRQMPGKPESVLYQSGFDAATGVDDAACMWLRFSDGAMAQMHVAFGVQYRSRYAIAGTRGRVELLRAFAVPPQMRTTLVLETDAGEEQIPLEPADQFRLMIEHFAAQILSETRTAGFEEELLRRHGVMDAAARSGREARVIEINNG